MFKFGLNEWLFLGSLWAAVLLLMFIGKRYGRNVDRMECAAEKLLSHWDNNVIQMHPKKKNVTNRV